MKNFRGEILLTWIGLMALCVPATASTYFLPQVAVGTSGDLQIQTVLTLSNPPTNTQNATIVLASCQDNGSEWVLNWDAPGRPDLSGPQSSIFFALLPGQTVTMIARSAGAVTTGWMFGRSDIPMVLTVRYSAARVSGGTTDPQWEVGVLPAAGLNEHFVFVSEGASDWSGSTTSTTLAIGNTTSTTASVTFALYGAAGGSPLKTRTITLERHAHTAQYISEIFPDMTFSGSFRGMLHISANVALAVVTLQGWTAGPKTTFAAAGALASYQAVTNEAFEAEPSDSAGQGEIVAVPAEVIGVLSSSSDGPDTDYFRLYLEAGHTLGVVGLGEVSGSPLAPTVALLTESGSSLATGLPVLPAFGDTALQVAIPQTGWYSLQVSSPSSAHGRRHFYRVFVGQK